MDMPSSESVKGRFLRDGAMGVKASALIHIAAAVQNGEGVEIGDDVYEFDTNASVTAGSILVDCVGGSEVQAQGTLTIVDGQNIDADETVTIGEFVYTFKAVPSAAYEVDIGTDDEATILNLVAAINLTGTAGTEYGAGTLIHPLVSAAASANTMIVTVKIPGTAGNAIASTEATAQASFGDTTLGDTTAGVDPTAGEATDALIAAINASGTEPVTAIDLATGDILLLCDAVHETDIDVTETMAGANNVVEATIDGGVYPTMARVYALAIVPNATQVLAGVICIPMEFEPTGALVQMRTTSTGASVAFDGKVTVDTTNDMLKIDNTGSTDFATTHTLSVLVF